MRPKSALLLLALALAGGAVWFFWLDHAPGTDQRRQQAALLLPGLDAGTVREVTITRGSGRIRIRRAESRWQLLEPLEMAAEKGQVESLLQQLAQTQSVERMPLAELKGGPAAAGFDEKAIRIRLRTDSGEREVTVGSLDAPGGRRLARVSGNDEWVLIGSGLAQTLEQDSEVFRNHDLFDLSADDIQEMKLETAGRPPVEFVRQKDNRWRLAAPLQEPADDDAVSGFLTRVLSARATRYVQLPHGEGAAGLAPPAFSIQMTGRKGKPGGRLVIGKEVPEAGGRYWMQSSARPGFGELEARPLIAGIRREPSSWQAKK